MRKKKKKKLDAATLVKEMSRENIGTVPATKVVPNKKRKRIKHKKRELALEQE